MLFNVYFLLGGGGGMVSSAVQSFDGNRRKVLPLCCGRVLYFYVQEEPTARVFCHIYVKSQGS